MIRQSLDNTKLLLDVSMDDGCVKKKTLVNFSEA